MAREQFDPGPVSSSLTLSQLIGWLSLKLPLFARLATTPLTVRTVTAATTFDARRDDVILVDTTGGSVTVTLPSPGAFATRGQPGYIKKLAAANTMTIDPPVNIDGAASHAVTAQWEAIMVISDGAHYYIV